MKLVLNEELLVNKALSMKCGEYLSDNKPSNSIKALIKEYYNNGLTKQQVRDAIEDFMYNHYKHYAPVEWKRNLDRWVKQSENDYTLINLKKIEITEDELTVISSIKGENPKNEKLLKKLLFIMVIHSKVYNAIRKNNDNWINSCTNELFRDAKITAKKLKKELLIGELIDKGVIIQAKKMNNDNLRVEFINDDSKGKVAVVVTDFEYPLSQYPLDNTIKYISCHTCNRTIIKTNNKKKYCDKCRDENKKIKNREYYRKSGK